MKIIKLNGWPEYDKSMVLNGSDLQKSLHNIYLGQKKPIVTIISTGNYDLVRSIC